MKQTASTIAALLLVTMLALYYQQSGWSFSGMFRRSGRPPRSPEEVRRAEVLAKLELEAAASNIPVDFYGVVQDSHDQPVTDIKVTCAIAAVEVDPGRLTSRRCERSITAHTDGRGVFHLNGEKGCDLTVRRLSPPWVLPFPGNAYTPNAGAHPAKPVRFIALRPSEIEKTQEETIHLKFEWDGLPKLFDLTTGRESETGELEIVPRRQNPETKPQDLAWCVDLRMHDGGLAQAGSAHSPLAPLSGYQEVLSYGRGYSDRNLVGSDPNSIVCFVRDAKKAHWRIWLALGPSKPPGSISSGVAMITRSTSGGRVIVKMPDAK